MVSIRRISLVALGTLASLTTALILAMPIFALEQAELRNISQNCPTIKQSLTKLQYADSRTRTYLGSIYEQLSNTFIAPLNARLVKSNIVNTELLEIQAHFAEGQAQFRSAYTDYMRELEGLLATDCSVDPQGFYQHLEVVRARRDTLRETTDLLSDLASQQLSAVKKLQETMP